MASRVGRRNLGGPFLEIDWITTGQDFEFANYRLAVPAPFEVVAYLKGNARGTPNGGGSNLQRLTTILQSEIDEAAPRVTVPRGVGAAAPVALTGLAADTVKAFLAQTSIHCDFARAGRCTLGHLTATSTSTTSTRSKARAPSSPIRSIVPA